MFAQSAIPPSPPRIDLGNAAPLLFHGIGLTLTGSQSVFKLLYPALGKTRVVLAFVMSRIMFQDCQDRLQVPPAHIGGKHPV